MLLDTAIDRVRAIRPSALSAEGFEDFTRDVLRRIAAGRIEEAERMYYGLREFVDETDASPIVFLAERHAAGAVGRT